jgi:drug/metabolite transporter (DMT)-like permease
MSQSTFSERSLGINGQNRATLIAFILLVIVGGSNAVAVRVSNLELPPFWGAATRFGAAALIFWFIVLLRRITLPKGKALVGALIYGLLSVGAAYAFLYWGLLRVPAGMTMVVLAFVPLMTLLLAVVHGLETFRWRGLIGALIAIAGIILGVYGGLGASFHVPSLLAVMAGGLCIAEAAVVFKLFPKSHPIATNSIAFTAGAFLLIFFSLIAGEEWQLPATANTWVAFIYLVLIGSVILFYLYLFVLSRWEASVTAYSFLLFPVATVIIAAVLLGEVVTISFVVGGVLVLAGVWLGAIKSPAPTPIPESSTPTEDLVT